MPAISLLTDGISMAINIRVGNLLGAPHPRSSVAQDLNADRGLFNLQVLA